MNAEREANRLSAQDPEGSCGPIGVVWVTQRGEMLANGLLGALEHSRRYEGPAAQALPRAVQECRAVVCFMAAGIAVRLAATALAPKETQPGIVCVDDAGQFAIALLGGHEGGANALARRVATILGATPVITTATESANVPDLSAFGSALGFQQEPGGDVAGVTAAVLRGEHVTVCSDQRWPLPALALGMEEGAVPIAPCILITDRTSVEIPAPAVVYRPPSLIVGVGCSSGVEAREILNLLDRCLHTASLSPRSVAGLASIDLKANEPGLREAARLLGVPLATWPASKLATVDVPNPSSVVAQAVATPSVAEAAALMEATTLVVPKQRSAHATVAVARRQPRGKLVIVGTGPGDQALLTPLAAKRLSEVSIVVGLERYVTPLVPLLRPGTTTATSSLGHELERAREAVAAAQNGAAVALVSGGDAGIYAMASPALELAGSDIDVEVIPGVTAAVAAAALLGAPLGHDHCAISLSDLLTPWDVIARRLAAAATGDFVTVLYNPRSTGRHWQLDAARTILAATLPPGTPVGLVTDAWRPTQAVVVTTLGQLDTSHVGMTTTVVIGNRSTRVIAGRMVTPRAAWPDRG